MSKFLILLTITVIMASLVYDCNAALFFYNIKHHFVKVPQKFTEAEKMTTTSTFCSKNPKNFGPEYYALPNFLSAARARAHCRKSERRSRSRSLKFLRAPLALALIKEKSAALPRALPEK